MIMKKEKLDILFVTCPIFGVEYPPIGIAYICEYLKKEGYKPAVYDLSMRIFKSCDDEFKKNWATFKLEYLNKKIVHNLIDSSKTKINEFFDYLNNKDVKIIGFSIYRSNRIFSYYIASEIKKRFKDKIIIFGGPGVKLEDEKDGLFKDCPNLKNVVDVLVKGEGEIATKKIVEGIKNKKFYPQKIKGIIYSNKLDKSFLGIIKRIIRGTKLIENKGQRRIENLDKFPFPKYKEFKISDYIGYPAFPIIFNRGCVNKCAFCEDWQYWDACYKSRSAENVFQEIRYHMNEYNSRFFEFNDLTFNTDLKKIEEFCDVVIKSKVKFLWSCNCIVREDMPYELFKKIKKSGCRIVRFGIESGSDRILKLMNKPFNSEQASKVLKRAHNAGLETHINILVGFPRETEEDFKKTFDFIKHNKKYISTVLNLSICFIHPGIFISTMPEKYGILTDDMGKPIFEGEEAKRYLLWKDDYGNDYQERKRRLYSLKDLLKSLNIPLVSANYK
jgi:radical SAM superfamily enzyme YgiQ (UPF0313 family)